MSELVQIRQRSPWLTYDIVYNLTPSGREHNRCLEILHGFTNKVAHYIYSIFIKENCIQLRKEKNSSNTLFCLCSYQQLFEFGRQSTNCKRNCWQESIGVVSTMNKASQETRCFEFSGKAEIERETRVVSRQDLIRFKFNGNKSICGTVGGGEEALYLLGVKMLFWYL